MARGGGDATGSSSWWYVSFRGLGLLALLPLPATDSGDVGGVEGNGDDVSKNVPLPSLLLFLVRAVISSALYSSLSG
jgi:hypothetical protein